MLQQPDDASGRISRTILTGAIDKAVSEKLGILFGEMTKFTAGMPPGDIAEAKLMILDMMRNATHEFHRKVESRLKTKQE